MFALPLNGFGDIDLIKMFLFRTVLLSKSLLAETGANWIASNTTNDPVEDGPTISLRIILQRDPEDT